MAEATNPESIEELVEWAYSTLPQTIKDLPTFPVFKWLKSRPTTC